MSAVDTGRYKIVNVKWGNLAFLPDPNTDSDIVGNIDNNSIGEQAPPSQWNVTRLSNGKYTLRSHGYSSYATVASRPSAGESAVGGTREKQWVIKEARVRGQFTVAPSDSDVFWGLADGESMTPITMAITPNDPKNQWKFVKD
ncbi:hypothetical protein FRC10_002448 [Ceratobasidium sp. 414]|nr:hypothetical protein FRC10_002448 [Ceratobasidium sp. 414]